MTLTKSSLRIFLICLVSLILVSVSFGLAVTSFSPIDTLTVNISQSQNFSVTLDNLSNITYVWRVNEAVLQTSNLSTFSYTPGDLGLDNVTVNATNLSGASVLQLWNVTVINSSAKQGLDSPAVVILGSDSQKASNRKSDDTDAHNVFVERSLILRNNEISTLTGVNATVSGANNFNVVNDLNLSVTLPQTTIGPSDGVEVKVRSRVPDRLDAINESTFKEVAPQVATITFTGLLPNGTQTTSTTSVNIQRKNQLIINDIDVCVETDCEDVGTDSKIENVRPGDRVEIQITVESLYSTREEENLDIEDVEIEYDIDEDKFSENDNEGIGDLGARDDDTHVFTFDVPDDIDSSVYDVVLTLIGKDENGAFHGTFEEFKLDIDRKAHDIQIRSLVLNPTSLSCDRRSFTLNVHSQNIGENDEDEGIITVKNSDIDLNREFGPFLIEQDEKRTDSVFYELPDFVKPADYTIVARAFFDKDKQTEEEGVVLSVRDCEDNATTSTEQNDSSSTEQKTTRTNTQTQRSSTSRTFSSPTSSSSSAKPTKSAMSAALPIFLAIIVGLIIVMGVVLVVLRRR